MRHCKRKSVWDIVWNVIRDVSTPSAREFVASEHLSLLKSFYLVWLACMREAMGYIVLFQDMNQLTSRTFKTINFNKKYLNTCLTLPIKLMWDLNVLDIDWMGQSSGLENFSTCMDGKDSSLKGWRAATSGRHRL